MKLYYAFSNTILFYQANIQANVSDEPADILVWSTNPMCLDLVEQIRKSGIFQNVYYLERPVIREGAKIYEKLKNYKLKKEFYDNYLQHIIGETKYSEFVTCGFWNDALIIYSYVKKYNKDIKVGVSEEGLLNYQCGKNHKKLYYMVVESLKKKLFSFIVGGRAFKDVQRRIVVDYLLQPKMLMEDIKNEVISHPAIDEDNDIMKNLSDNVYEEYKKKLSENKIEEYEKRKFIYMVSPFSPAYDPVNCVNRILNAVTSSINPCQLIFKVHTNHTAARNEFGKNVQNKGMIDTQIYLFEILASHLQSIEEKVFIIRNSSLAIYLTQFFKVEPTFIFTYKLYSRYHYDLDKSSDKYVETLKKNMKHPERVIVPSSISELQLLCKEMSTIDEEQILAEEAENNEQFDIPESIKEYSSNEIVNALIKLLQQYSKDTE